MADFFVFRECFLRCLVLFGVAQVGGVRECRVAFGLGVSVAKVGKRVGLWWLFCLFFYFPTFYACRGRDCLLL